MKGECEDRRCEMKLKILMRSKIHEIWYLGQPLSNDLENDFTLCSSLDITFQNSSNVLNSCDRPELDFASLITEFPCTPETRFSDSLRYCEKIETYGNIYSSTRCCATLLIELAYGPKLIFEGTVGGSAMWDETREFGERLISQNLIALPSLAEPNRIFTKFTVLDPTYQGCGSAIYGSDLPEFAFHSEII